MKSVFHISNTTNNSGFFASAELIKSPCFNYGNGTMMVIKFEDDGEMCVIDTRYCGAMTADNFQQLALSSVKSRVNRNFKVTPFTFTEH